MELRGKSWIIKFQSSWIHHLILHLKVDILLITWACTGDYHMTSMVLGSGDTEMILREFTAQQGERSKPAMPWLWWHHAMEAVGERWGQSEKTSWKKFHQLEDFREKRKTSQAEGGWCKCEIPSKGISTASVQPPGWESAWPQRPGRIPTAGIKEVWYGWRLRRTMSAMSSKETGGSSLRVLSVRLRSLNPNLKATNNEDVQARSNPSGPAPGQIPPGLGTCALQDLPPPLLRAHTRAHRFQVASAPGICDLWE